MKTIQSISESLMLAVVGMIAAGIFLVALLLKPIYILYEFFNQLSRKDKL